MTLTDLTDEFARYREKASLVRTIPASSRSHGGTVLGDVLVEQDAGLGIAQQQRQRGLMVDEGAVVQILTIVVDDPCAGCKANSCVINKAVRRPWHRRALPNSGFESRERGPCFPLAYRITE